MGDFRFSEHMESLAAAISCPIHTLILDTTYCDRDPKKLVLALDDSALDIDQVKNLTKFSPTKEEMELMKNYTGDKDNLGKCEQFFMELMKVPRVETKLGVFSFKMQFVSQVSDLRKNLNIVNSASEELAKGMAGEAVLETAKHQLEKNLLSKGGQVAALNQERQAALLAARKVV